MMNSEMVTVEHGSAGYIGPCYNTSLPRRSMYWEPKDDALNLAVSKTMSRNRFDQLMKYLHLANNEALGQGDRMAKVRSLYKLLNSIS